MAKVDRAARVEAFEVMFSKGSVLVVDDEVNLCRILGAKLSKNGYVVVAVHDGVQAVEKIREGKFDVVLLDLILPKKDGLTALSEIRHLNRKVPIIIMTACESSETVEQAMSYGASAYVSKPFDLDSLVTLVDATSKAECLHTKPEHAPQRTETSVLFTKDQPITIEIFNGASTGQYLSRIENRDDKTLSVCAPEKDGRTIHIPTHTVVRIGMAANDAFYSFSTCVASQKSSILVLEKPGVIYRTQRRRHERLATDVPLRFRPSNSDEVITGTCRDYSLGGLCIIVDRELRSGTDVYIETDPILEVGIISGTGRVVRVRKLDNSGDQKFAIGLQFVQLDDDLRANISRRVAIARAAS